jgi:hypothetical protein
MPLRNRVNPFGELVATPAGGTLMGNRGCLHNSDREIRTSFVGKRWILCLLQFQNRHRSVMSPGRYTELFFLDEATGLAAGHRPCAECQRERYLHFRSHWAAANPGLAGSTEPSADVLDAALHADRLVGRRRRTREADLAALPPGVMVVLPGDEIPVVVLPDGVRGWSFGGYGPPRPRPNFGRVRVLTPLSIVRAVAGGFPVGLHPSAAGVPTSPLAGEVVPKRSDGPGGGCSPQPNPPPAGALRVRGDLPRKGGGASPSAGEARGDGDAGRPRADGRVGQPGESLPAGRRRPAAGRRV